MGRRASANPAYDNVVKVTDEAWIAQRAAQKRPTWYLLKLGDQWPRCSLGTADLREARSLALKAYQAWLDDADCDWRAAGGNTSHHVSFKTVAEEWLAAQKTDHAYKAGVVRKFLLPFVEAERRGHKAISPVRERIAKPNAENKKWMDLMSRQIALLTGIQRPADENPWGSAEGADRWEAGNMANALLGRSDYRDAVQHFAGEFRRDPVAARSYTAAVYEDMAKANPRQAQQFARQMADGGLVTLQAEEGGGDGGTPPEEPDVPETPPEELDPPDPGDKPDPEDKPEEPEDECEDCEGLQATFEEKQAEMQDLQQKMSEEEILLSSIEADIEEIPHQMHDLEELMAEQALQGKGDYDVGRIPQKLRYLFRLFPGLGTLRGVTEATDAAMEYYHNEVLPTRSRLEKERQEVLSRIQELEASMGEAESAADAAAQEFQRCCGGGGEEAPGPNT